MDPWEIEGARIAAAARKQAEDYHAWKAAQDRAAREQGSLDARTPSGVPVRATRLLLLGP